MIINKLCRECRRQDRTQKRDAGVLLESSFNPDRLFHFLDKEAENAIKEGYFSLRITAEISWLSEDTHENIEEALCNISIEGLREQLSEAYCMGYDFQHPYVISLSRKLDRLH